MKAVYQNSYYLFKIHFYKNYIFENLNYENDTWRILWRERVSCLIHFCPALNPLGQNSSTAHDAVSANQTRVWIIKWKLPIYNLRALVLPL